MNFSDAAQSIAEQLRTEMARPIRLSRQQVVNVSASIGLTSCPADGADVNTLLKNADTAMYKAKTDGRNRCVWFSDELNELTLQRHQLGKAIQEGFERGEFRVEYQPIFELQSYSLTGVEALLRWTTQDGEDVAPRDFMPVAEQTGMICKLDAFVLDSACVQIAEWHRRGAGCRVAINVSALRLQQPGIVDEVAAVIARHKVPSSRIEFEVSESAALLGVSNIIEKLEAFTAMGVGVSIDDFGTAFSSLNYLKNLPVNCLKVDHSFVCAIKTKEDELSPDARMIRAIVALGKSLDITVIAEGVETQLQLQFLHQLGCDEAQGFLFGKPAAADTIEPALVELVAGKIGASASRPTTIRKLVNG